MDDSRRLFLGIDIGGTKVAGGLIDTRGEILYSTRTLMNAQGSAELALDCVRIVIDQVLTDNPGIPIAGIGLSSAGVVDPHNGTVIEAANLPCWRDFPLAAIVEGNYGVPTLLHNDANAAGMAEALWVSGRRLSIRFLCKHRNGHRHCVCSGESLIFRTHWGGWRRWAHDHRHSWRHLPLRQARLHRNPGFRPGHCCARGSQDCHGSRSRRGNSESTQWSSTSQ